MSRVPNDRQIGRLEFYKQFFVSVVRFLVSSTTIYFGIEGLYLHKFVRNFLHLFPVLVSQPSTDGTLVDKSCDSRLSEPRVDQLLG